jgi:hypothetical protein
MITKSVVTYSVNYVNYYCSIQHNFYAVVLDYADGVRKKACQTGDYFYVEFECFLSIQKVMFIYSEPSICPFCHINQPEMKVK